MAAAIRVLCVDDDPLLLEVGTKFLEKSGDFTVTTATSASDAIRLLEQETFDTIVSDYQMPEMDGIQFLVEVRTKFGEIPFILFTGKGREEVVIKALNAGADGYLQKGGEPSAQFAELAHKIKVAASRKRVDDALRTSEEKYRHLIEHADEAIVVVQEGMVKLVNHRTVELTEHSKQELLSASISTFVHPDDRAMVMERYQKRMKGEESPSRYSFRLSPKDGSTRWVEISVAAIDWEEHPATLNFLTDITERKQAEEALLASESRYRTLAESSTDNIFIIGRDDTIQFVNSSAARTLHFPIDEIIGKPRKNFFFSDIADIQGNHLRKVLDTGEPSRGEDKHLYGNQEFWQDTTLAPLKDETGNVTAVLGVGRDITERKKMEEMLQESEEKYRTLFSGMPSGVAIYEAVDDGEDFVFKDFNTAGEAIEHVRKEEVIGRRVTEVFPGLKEFGIFSVFQRVWRTGKPEFFPMAVYRDASDPGTWRESWIYKLPTGEIVSIYNDITDRKQAEEALTESFATFKIVMDSLDALVYVADMKTYEILFINQYGRKIWGDLTGKICWESLQVDQKGPCPFCTNKKLLDLDGNPAGILIWEFQNTINGQWYECHDSAIQWTDGRIVRIEIASDITERKQMEERLVESKEHFRAIYDQSPIAIELYDSAGTLVHANTACLKLFGVENLQVMRSFSLFADPNINDEYKAKLHERETIHYQGPFDFEKVKTLDMYPTSRDGIIWLDVLITPLGNRTDSISGFLVQVLDITERKRAEEKIMAALAEKEVLLREIHHRVKNNLAGILSLIDLQIGSLTDPVNISQFKELETRIRSMALVHESLTLSEDLARINIASYTDNLIRHLFAVYGTATDIRCKIEMGDVTMSIETAIPCGMVMSEIVTNSLKYAFPNNFSCMEIRGEPCTIALTMHREGSDYLLTIADNGIGIPEGSEVAKSPSLGLFLIGFIVKHQLRGSLLVSTTEGSVYTIRFPAPEGKERNNDE